MNLAKYDNVEEQLSGQIEAVLIFAGLSVAGLFLYWSRNGPTLDGSE